MPKRATVIDVVKALDPLELCVAERGRDCGYAPGARHSGKQR
jgi:hypothetical protein